MQICMSTIAILREVSYIVQTGFFQIHSILDWGDVGTADSTANFDAASDFGGQCLVPVRYGIEFVHTTKHFSIKVG